MAITIQDFAHDFFQEILTEADSSGRFLEDVFFEKFCVCLTDAGEMDTADRVHYRGPQGSGIRVDGYGGDLDSESGTFNLIIADFNQADGIDRLVGSEMNAIFQRLSRFLRKALDQKWRNTLEETTPVFGLADLIDHHWARIGRVRMFLISNRELSERIDGREADTLDGREITYSVWDMRRFYRFVAVGHGREEIEIDLMRDFNKALPLLPAHLSSGAYESYLAVVPGEMLATIYDRWGARLLEQNVRVFLQARGNVNKGIRNTLDNDPAMFFAYNNGITATAGSLKTETKDGQQLLTGLTDFQIVNGGQTTASIHAAWRSKVDVSSVFIQMKLSVVDSQHTDDVVPKISEYANSQNRVSAADFFANHPFHVRMEEFSRRIYAPSPDGTFRQTKWFYERARGQYADARSPLTIAGRRKFDLENPRAQFFSKTDLAKYVNAWSGHPDKVSLGSQKNFAHFASVVGKEWKQDDNAFNEEYFRDVVSRALIFKATVRIVSVQPWYQGGYRANIVAYTIAKMAYDVNERKLAVDFENIWKRQSLSDAMNDALALIAEQVHKTLTTPPSGISNVTEWAKKPGCWDKVKALTVNLPDKFVGELITIAEKKTTDRSAVKQQKIDNGIEAQRYVLDKGPDFLKKVIDWGRQKKLLSPKDIGILSVTCKNPGCVPSEKQSLVTVKILKKLKDEGCPHAI